MSRGSSEIRNTHFAITTINMPDRLDVREMEDRRLDDADSDRRRARVSAIRAWAPRMGLLALIVGIAFVLVEAAISWKESISPLQLSSRLSSALGVPVTVGSSEVAFTPSPRLIFRTIEIDHQLTLAEVSVGLRLGLILRGLRDRDWEWGEAVFGPQALSVEQGKVLLDLAPKLERALPESMTSVRFNKLEISNQAWFPGPWEVSAARGKDGGFTTIEGRQQKGTSSLKLDFTPAIGDDANGFQFEARNWQPPFGMAFPVEVILANGKMSPGRLAVDKISLGGQFGTIEGEVLARQDRSWFVDAKLHSEGVDLENLILAVARGPTKADESASPASSLLQGTAAFSGRATGSGSSLEAAVSNAQFEAPVKVRWPVLNGINLGYVATHAAPSAGSGGGGTTRFSTLEGKVVFAGGQLEIQDLHGSAGALTARGQINMSADHHLSGTVHVDMGVTRVLAPIRLSVRGSLNRVEFGP